MEYKIKTRFYFYSRGAAYLRWKYWLVKTKIGWWSNGGRKPHKMTIDHTYNRLKDSMMQVSVVEWSNFFEN